MRLYVRHRNLLGLSLAIGVAACADEPALDVVSPDEPALAPQMA